MSDVIGKIKELQEMLQSGLITEQEFQKLKKRVLQQEKTEVISPNTTLDENRNIQKISSQIREDIGLPEVLGVLFGWIGACGYLFTKQPKKKKVKVVIFALLWNVALFPLSTLLDSQEKFEVLGDSQSESLISDESISIENFDEILESARTPEDFDKIVNFARSNNMNYWGSDVYQRISKVAEEECINEGFPAHHFIEHGLCKGKKELILANAGTPPTPSAEWSSVDFYWLCPLSTAPEYKTSRECSVGDIPSEEEKQEATNVANCMLKSGKEKQTMGWDWAREQCQKDVNVFGFVSNQVNTSDSPNTSNISSPKSSLNPINIKFDAGSFCGSYTGAFIGNTTKEQNFVLALGKGQKLTIDFFGKTSDPTAKVASVSSASGEIFPSMIDEEENTYIYENLPDNGEYSIRITTIYPEDGVEFCAY